MYIYVYMYIYIYIVYIYIYILCPPMKHLYKQPLTLNPQPRLNP